MNIRVTGKVQGVFFRTETKNIAEGLGLTGYVRNNPDGSVSIEVEGVPAAIEEMLQWCESGPPAARVSAAETQPGHLQHYTTFEIK